MRFANITAAFIGMIFSAAAFIKTLFFKQFLNVPVGPEFFPRALSVGLFVCCLILFIQNFLNKNDTSEAPTISPKSKDIQRLLIGIGIVLVSAFLWTLIGFIPTTILSLFALSFLLGKRNWIFMAIYSVVLTIIIFCAFKFMLGIEMPMGFFGNI